MKSIKTIFFIFLLVFYVKASAQNLYPSRVRINTEMEDSMWYAVSNAGIVQVNETTGEIALKMDLSTIITDDDKLDSSISNIRQQYLYLKGNFPISNLSFSDNDNEIQKDFTGKAWLSLNGLTKEINYTAEVFSFNNDDQFAVGNTVYPLRIGLFFEFEPEDFNLDKIYKPLTGGIEVEVSNGLINRTNQGGSTIFPK